MSALGQAVVGPVIEVVAKATAAVHGGVQAEDRPGGRRMQDVGRGRGVAATGGARTSGTRAGILTIDSD